MSDFNIVEWRATVNNATEYLKEQVTAHFKKHAINFAPKILIIAGSGLGGIGKRVSKDIAPLTVPYSDVPGFKTSTVSGHSGTLVFGYMSDVPVVIMNGRLHGYEGYTPQDNIFPLRVLKGFNSIEISIITNAAGGINREFKTCEIMCINDHISFPGLSGNHPLRGANVDEHGPRFLAVSDAYDLDLRKLLFKKHSELKIERRLHEGVYAHVSGPTYESRAEARLIKLVGGDCVGMSTVPEVIAARHCDWRVLAISLITNQVVLDPPPKITDENPVPSFLGKADHQEVLDNSIKASADVVKLVEAVVVGAFK